MMQVIEVRLPVMPDCWDSCGACRDGAVLISDILVKPGQQVNFDEPIVSLESDKTTLDIPSPQSGRVIEVVAEIGDAAEEGMLLLTLEHNS